MNDREEKNRVYEDTVADGADIVVISTIDTHTWHTNIN